MTLLFTKLLLPIVGVLLFASRHVHTAKCGVSNGSNMRIIGGHDASPHQFPWMAYIQNELLPLDSTSNSQTLYKHCNGVLIDDAWILSTASCFNVPDHYKRNETLIVLGVHNLEDRNEVRIVGHPAVVCG